MFTTADLHQCLCDHTYRAYRFNRRVSRKHWLNSGEALRHRKSFFGKTVWKNAAERLSHMAFNPFASISARTLRPFNASFINSLLTPTNVRALPIVASRKMVFVLVLIVIRSLPKIYSSIDPSSLCSCQHLSFLVYFEAHTDGDIRVLGFWGTPLLWLEYLNNRNS